MGSDSIEDIVARLSEVCLDREEELRLERELEKRREEAIRVLVEYISSRKVRCYSQIIYAISRLGARREAVDALLRELLKPEPSIPPEMIGRRLHYLHAPPRRVIGAALGLVEKDPGLLFKALAVLSSYAAPWNADAIYMEAYPKLLEKARERMFDKRIGLEESYRIMNSLISLVSRMGKGYDLLLETLLPVIALHLRYTRETVREFCSKCLCRLSRLLVNSPLTERRRILRLFGKLVPVVRDMLRDETVFETKYNTLRCIYNLLKYTEADRKEAPELYALLEDAARSGDPELRDVASRLLADLEKKHGVDY